MLYELLFIKYRLNSSLHYLLCRPAYLPFVFISLYVYIGLIGIRYIGKVYCTALRLYIYTILYLNIVLFVNYSSSVLYYIYIYTDDEESYSPKDATTLETDFAVVQE